MKKVLSVLSFLAILSTSSVMAAPPPPPGGHGGPRGGVERRVPPPPPHGRPHGHIAPSYHRYHGGAVAVGLGARPAYWGYPYRRHRLICPYDYYSPYCDGYGYYPPANVGIGFYFGF